MTLRSKYRTLVWCWLLIAFLSLIGAMYITGYLEILLILTTLAIGGYSLSLKCPSCGKRVLYNPIKILGLEFYTWTPWIPKNCTKCNKELD